MLLSNERVQFCFRALLLVVCACGGQQSERLASQTVGATEVGANPPATNPPAAPAAISCTSPNPGALAIARDGDGSNTVSLSGGTPGGEYQVEFNADLSSGWKLLTDVLADATGRFSIRDASDQAVRFYRAEGVTTCQCSTPSLSAPIVSPGLSGAAGLAISDFNRDSRVDVATADIQSSVEVLLGNGDGSFQSPEYVFAGEEDFSAWAGDINADGKPDFVAGSIANQSIFVRLGNGDGTFQPASQYPLVGTPVLVSTADVNRDGNLDVVSVGTGTYGTNLSILLGRGDGTFQPERTVVTSTQGLTSMALADLNGDGAVDIIASNASTVLVLIGAGNGTFQVVNTYSPGYPNLSSTAIADLDGDNKLDVFFTSLNGITNSWVLTMMGNGDGTFKSQTVYTMGPGTTRVAAGDINGDGKLDLVANAALSSAIHVMLGNGNGTFQSALDFPAGDNPNRILITDVNGDARPDIIIGNVHSGGVAVLLNTCHQ